MIVKDKEITLDLSLSLEGYTGLQILMIFIFSCELWEETRVNKEPTQTQWEHANSESPYCFAIHYIPADILGQGCQTHLNTGPHTSHFDLKGPVKRSLLSL